MTTTPSSAAKLIHNGKIKQEYRMCWWDVGKKKILHPMAKHFYPCLAFHKEC